ncbi:hypothetical protein VB816_13115 [Limnoraphis robusta CCNP1324]|uniref:hypothetical protein n=1 Tax=Limnoraphis robusta TaxID=1118279 RepID=UPI002B218465|nr:hypothetical protein [Limnoraphis robusta]MEA5545921.1 hypothetical protein [Limnoraphis robusta CCNP1324]
MDDDPTSLDHRRGADGRKATDLRRLRARIEADQAAVRTSQAELEVLLAATPASSIWDVVETARYLLELFADGATAADPSRRRLIARTLADFDRLAADDDDAPAAQTREKRAVGKSGRGGSGRGPSAGAGRKRSASGVVTPIAAHRKAPSAKKPPDEGADS